METSRAAHLVVIYREILANLGFPQTAPTPIYENNSAALSFAQNGCAQRSLHYDIKYLFVHELQKQGVLQVIPMQTSCQLADICTKPCTWDVSSRLLPVIMGMDLSFSRHVDYSDE